MMRTDKGDSGQMLSPFSQRVVRNTLFNLLGRLGVALAPIVLTPYTIHVLGLEVFGVWVLVTSAVSYLSLSDFGVAAALSRHAARDQATGDVGGLNRLLNVALAYYVAAGAAIAALAWLLAKPIVALVGVPPALQAQASVVLIGCALVLAVTQTLSVAESLLTGLQLMDVTSSISLAGTLLDVAATVAVLGLGYGLLGLVVKDGVLALALGAARAAALVRLQPGLALRPAFASRRTLNELLSYGLRIQVTRLAELTATHVDKLLLGHFVGVQIVAEYEVAARIVRMAKYLVLTVTSAVMPAAAALQTLGQSAKVLGLYYRSSKYLFLAAAPVTLFLIAAAPNILLAWVGPGYGNAALFLQALAVGHVVHTMTSAGTTIVRGIGHPEYETHYTVILLIGGTLLGVSLIGLFGAPGAVVATPLALVVSSLYFFAIVHRLFGASGRYVMRIGALPLAASGALAVGVWLILSAGSRVAAGRWPQLVLLAAVFAAYVLAYGALLWRRSYLDALDWAVIRRYVPLRGRR